MKRIFSLMLVLLVGVSGMHAQKREVTLSGTIIDGFLKTPLVGVKASICRTDSTVLVDSCAALIYYKSDMTPMYSTYSTTLKTDAQALLVHTQKPGYGDAWQRVELGKQSQVDVPEIAMRKELVSTLGEVTVTATRVKMFYKGDTLVYDATAFQLPDGSMLDDLIRQMPGVTLNQAGEIYVNGRKVDELLLGSQTFMRGNKKVLMENLPYFTVKDIKVYEKQSDRSKALGYDVDPKSYVMDVNLKPDYQRGYIANVEGAVGAPLSSPQGGKNPDAITPPWGSREGATWLTRGFMLGFTDRTRLTFFANANNVNESRHIGQSDHWTPNTMPQSLTTTYSGAAEMFYHSKGDVVKETFTADYTRSKDVTDMRQRYEQFLAGSNPWSLSMSKNHAGNSKLQLKNEFRLTKNLYQSLDLNFHYATRDGSYNSVFEQWSDTLVATNRSVGMSEGKDWGGRVNLSGSFNINKEKHRNMHYMLTMEHTTDESRAADRYDVQQMATAMRTTQHNSNDYLNRHTWGIGNMSTGLSLGKGVDLRFGETVDFISWIGHDYLYHPDTLMQASQLDMLSAITDPTNSYDMRRLIVSSSPSISLMKNATTKRPDFGSYTIHYTPWDLNISVPYKHEQLDYKRGLIDTLAMQDHLFVNFSGNGRLMLKDGTHDVRGGASYENSLVGLLDQLPFRDTSRPLVIREGNPNLKNDITTNAHLDYYNHDLHGHLRNIHLGALMRYLNRSMAQSVTYAPETGVYTYRPMNVHGNYLLEGKLDFGRSLGEKNYWSIQSNTLTWLHHSVDHAMLAGMTASEENVVNTLFIQEGASVQYNRKQLNIRAKGDIHLRHSEGRMYDFTTLNALDYQYGLSARYTLPRIKTTLSAEGTMFSRRGYGSSTLNTDDFVLNASISQPFLKGKLIARIEGFDLLHQLSSTQYTVNAQGRTETWYRSLPHYVMFHLVYHWNKNPKK